MEGNAVSEEYISAQSETYWGRFADDFEERQRYVTGENAFLSVVHQLRKESGLGSLLEVGCGTGSYTMELIGKTDDIVATDYSADMVQAIAERTRNLSSVTCMRADAYELPFRSNRFDSVLIANMIHVIDLPEIVLRECERVLKPGGRLFITSFTQQGMKLSERIKLSARYMKTFGIPSKTHGSKLTLNRTEALLKGAGFFVVKSKLVGYEVKCIYTVGVKS